MPRRRRWSGGRSPGHRRRHSGRLRDAPAAGEDTSRPGPTTAAQCRAHVGRQVLAAGARRTRCRVPGPATARIGIPLLSRAGIWAWGRLPAASRSCSRSSSASRCCRSLAPGPDVATAARKYLPASREADHAGDMPRRHRWSGGRSQGIREGILDGYGTHLRRGRTPPGRGRPRQRHATPMSGARSWRRGSVGPDVGCQALRLLESGSRRSAGLGPGRGAEPHGRARPHGRRVARRSFKSGLRGSRTSSWGRENPRVAEDLRAIDKPLRKRIVEQRIQPRVGPYVIFLLLPSCFP